MSIDIKAAIEKSGLDYAEAAEQIFPDNVHPRLALNRVVKGEAFLNERQIRKLAALTGSTVAELFGESVWKSTRKHDTLVFTSKDFKAELNVATWETKIFHNETLFHDSVIHSGFIPLSEYISKLNELITNYLNKK